MEKNTLKNVKQRFAEARQKCPGMHEDIYALTDYISIIANDYLVPEGLLMCITEAMDNLEKGKQRFNLDEQLQKYLNNRRNQIINKIVFIPQVVDAIADEKFAEEFRKICENFYGFNPPKRIITDSNSKYPENICAAVEWWANAIQSPTFDIDYYADPSLMMKLYGKPQEYSEEKLKLFKDALAQEISNELQKKGFCTLDVDYLPCEALSKAGEKIGLDNITDYPLKTVMEISNEVVEVTEGYGAPRKTIWSSKKKQDINESSRSFRKNR